MKKLSVLLSLVLVFLLGFSPLVQGANFDNLSQDLEAFIKEREAGTASVSLGIFKEGQVLDKTHYGYIDQENQVPSGDQTIYEWGSVSKVLVWISLMQLEEEGKIDLSQDLKTYLPEDFSGKLTYPYPLTLLDIMNLQSGFQEVGIKVEFEEGEAIPDLPDLLLASQPRQIYQPKTVVAYNNWTPALAAYLVETVSGQAFYAYVQDHIFAPLSMDHTAVAPDWRDNDFVKSHRPQSKSYYYSQEDRESLGTSILHIGLYPAGATAGTFEDFLTFATEFTQDQPRFFKKAETFDRMMEASVLFSDGLPRIHHGLLSIDDGRHLVGHSGNTQGFTSSFWFDPQTKTGYGVMTNEPGETAYNYGLAQFLFGPGPGAGGEGSDISGLYTSQRTIDQGPLRFIKYLSGVLPIKKTHEAGVFKVPLAGMKVSYLGGHRYRFDNDNGLAYQVVARDQDRVLENFTTDSKALPPLDMALAYGLALSALLVLLALVPRFIYRLVARLRKKREKILDPGLTSHLLASLISLSFVYLWLITNTYSKPLMVGVSLLGVLSSLLLCGNFLAQVPKKAQGQKAHLVATAWPLVMVAFVIFFQFYKFWV
ncbi:MAG: serine hydrolase [Tissierellia bacterium]|nr:serine hydrolase [Tissierellia bacterium]